MNQNNKRTANLTLPDLSFLHVYCKIKGIDENAKRKLTANLNRIWLGSDDVYRSPFAKDLEPNVILEMFDKEVFEPNTNRINKVLFDLEVSQREKFGPRSIALPWNDWKMNFLKSFNLDKIEFSNTLKFKTRSSLRPMSIKSAARMIRKSTAASLPTMKKKSTVLENSIRTFSIEEATKYACVLYTRTQESKKIRGVWGYSLYSTLLEASYFYPILEERKKLTWRSALRGPDFTSMNITRLINIVKESTDYVCLSIDFSDFDASVSPILSRYAFDNLSAYFQERYRDEFSLVANLFTNIEICTPDGILSGEHGVGSGSNFTNEIDSEVHKEVALSSGVVNDNHFDIQGDDGAFIIETGSIPRLFETFRKAGFVLNESKSYFSPVYFVYLQKLFHEDYRDESGLVNGIYPLYRSLNRLIFQERWSTFEDYNISGQDYYSLRAISILENCRYHPLFEELVRFVIKYDKYSLAYTNKGLKDFVNMIEQTEGSRGIFSNQYGDNIRGINTFETVKLIKKITS